VELQIESVTIDMYRYLGWFPNEEEILKKASIKAQNDLQAIKRHLQKLSFTGQLVDLKETSLAITDRLIQIYDGIESKKQEDIKESFAGLNNIYSQYSEKCGKIIKQNTPFEKLAEEFDSKREEAKLAQNQQDRQVYLNAVELIQNKNFVRAYNDLASLKKNCTDTIFESCINFRMSDCLLMAEPNGQGDSIFNPEKGIALLSDILDSRKYSLVLFDTFYKWRTQTQSFWHGMSNMSEIPNWRYNLKRWQAVQTIRQYLKTNPDDVWANAQVGLLLNLSNIGRGGSFGNDNLSYWGDIYLNNNSGGE